MDSRPQGGDPAGHSGCPIGAESGTSSPEWYTGLVVSPASFSRQLSEMQLSLMRANNEPHPQLRGTRQTAGQVEIADEVSSESDPEKHLLRGPVLGYTVTHDYNPAFARCRALRVRSGVCALIGPKACAPKST